MRISLPFEIGDTVYCIDAFCVDERKVDSVVIDENGITVYTTKAGNNIESFNYNKYWGIFYFSSKEEAENYRLNGE